VVVQGTVIKRGKKWSVIIDIGRDADGKRLREWHSGFERKRDAEAARIEILSRMASGRHVAPSKVTVAEYLDSWLENRKNLAETTKGTYRFELRRITDILGPRRLAQLQPGEISACYSQLLASGLSAKTVRNSHGVFHKALKDALREGLVARNVADGVELPRRHRPDTPTWTAAQAHAFLSFVESHRLYAGWLLIITTGMRRSELLGLRWQHVNLDAGLVAVVDTLVEVNNKPVLRIDETKTSGSRRTIAVDPVTVDALKAHHTQQSAEKLRAGEVYQDRDMVFCNEVGDPVSPDWFTRTTKSLATEAGVPPLTPHAAGRHTMATLALESGVPAKVVAERLGHASITTTLDRYSHVTEGMDRDAASTVADLIARS
jgi:integrase